MAKTFREWKVAQPWLLPPSVQELVPAGSPAHFIRDLVREELDLSAILDCYQEERGFPPFHPAMMTALLLFAYTQGVYSSRRIAKACEARLDFMAVTAAQKPDFRTINKFRKRHLKALADLFGQVLRLCQQAKMVKLGHVALDGTKIQANASKHKAMSYGRMKKTEKELAAEVAKWFELAEAADESEDAEYGADKRGDEMPDWVKNKAKRLEVIRKAKAELEAKAKAEVEAQNDSPDDDPSPPRGRGGSRTRKMPKPNGEPNDAAQLSFTDKESKILKGPNGFLQGYNCQAAVDSASQVIVAHSTEAAQNDAPMLLPIVDQIAQRTGTFPDELSADTGYISEANLEGLEQRGVRAYIATGRQRHGTRAGVRLGTQKGTRIAAMRKRLERAGHRSRYRLRKQTVEPVFGQIKEGRGFRRFSLRGKEQVAHEWALVCTAHNLLKLAKKCA